MSSRENEDAFVISKIMKGGPEVPGRQRNVRGGGGWRGNFSTAMLREGENEGKRKGISGF